MPRPGRVGRNVRQRSDVGDLLPPGIPTERCLAVIGFPDGTIGVRSAPNLIRPAHIFRYLKQNRHAEVKAGRLLHRSRNRKRHLDHAGRSRATLPNGARLLRPQLRKAGGATRRRVHLQLALMGRRQHARQRRHSRLTDRSGSLPRSTTSIASKTSIAIQPRWPSSVVGPERWSRCSPRRWTSSRPAKNLNTFRNAECLRLRPRVRDGRDQRMLWRIGFTPEQISYLMNNAQKQIRDFDRDVGYF